MEGDVAAASREAVDAVATLRRRLKEVVQRLSTRSGKHVVRLLATSDSDSELSKVFRHHVVLKHRAEGVACVERARQEGRVARALATETILDLLYGPIFFRLMIGHGMIDDGFVDELVDAVFPRSG